MPRHITESQNRALVKRAIKYAEAQAGNDADFLQILRATYFTNHPEFGASFRGDRLNGARAARGVRGVPADPSRHIYDDPRFLENARLLAKSTKQNLRIMGGEKVVAKDFPDCVAVGSDTEWGCTGTLIAPNVVLTAGHCSDFATRVFFGSDVSKKGTTIAVARRERHPSYHKGKKNDLLVLVLEKAVSVKPRKIAATAAVNSAKVVRAVGFGNVDASGRFGYGIKRQVDLPVASPSCTGKVKDETDTMAYGCDRDLELVAGKPMLAKDSCNGDSGGPLYLGSPAKGWQLAGATSRATESAMSNCGDGGIYVRVDQYREWIEEAAQVKLP